MSGILEFLKGCGREVATGKRLYWIWVAFLVGAVAVGGVSYAYQAREGLIATNMRDDVSWAFYQSHADLQG
jgi:molybdopterin-containing oxidoreductase family membrane subunit